MDENPTTETLGSTACLAFCASHVPAALFPSRWTDETPRSHRKRFFGGKTFWLVLFPPIFTGTAPVLASALELLTTVATYEHWSRFVVMCSASRWPSYCT